MTITKPNVIARTDVSRSPIPADAYVSDDVLLAEQRKIFGSLWIFVGMKQLLDAEDSHLTRTIADVPVVIQRMNGRLRAFENRCLHRQMALQWASVGTRPLICKYHGWTYGPNGCVRGIPNAQYYEFGDESVKALCLREFALKEVGNLLFVCVGDKPPSFEAQFGREFVDDLTASSSKFDAEVAYTTFDVKYNWKLNFENVLDYNHPQFIHPKSFYPILHDGTGAERKAAISSDIRKLQEDLAKAMPIQLSDLSFATHGPLAIGPNPWGDQVDRFGERDDYYNWFIYPNVNYCSVHGRMFLVQQYVPKSPGVTEYHLWVVTARRKDPRMVMSGLLWSLIKEEKMVIDEDAVALEQLQSKLTSGSDATRHGAYEAQIARMHRWYAERLDFGGNA